MAWAVYLSENALAQLRRLPRDEQRLVSKAIDRMQTDPFQGDVRPLHGKRWKGRHRKRVGRYRLIFIPHPGERQVEISAIILRTEHTYR